MRVLFGIFFIIAFTIPGESLCEGVDVGLENPPGWVWLINPKPASYSSWSSSGVLAEHRETCDGQFEITIAMQVEEGSDYRAVAIDNKGDRHELAHRGGGSGDLVLWTFSELSGELSFDRVEFVGIEVLSQEGWPAASKEAAVRAEKAGTKTLPLPQVGISFEFDLVGVDGVEVNSKNYLGNVTIIDCWATWCNPCMKKMPVLKQFKEKWGSQGLKVIGVNFDQDLGKARRTIEESGLNWPQIGVPPDQVARKLWWEVSGVSMLPRVFILDRNGVLVYDGRNMEEIEKVISGLFLE